MRFSVSVALPILLAISFPIVAEDAGPPAWMKDVTRLPPGGHAVLRPVELKYTLSWNNRVNAGKLEISISRAGEQDTRFVGEANGGSTGFARVLWPYDFRARSIVDEDSLRPITFQLSERERDEVSSYDIIFEPQRQVFTTRSREENEEARTATSKFQFDFGQDMLSSAFYLRSQRLEPGQEITMVVTPFNKPYLAQFEVLGSEKHEVKGTSFDAIKLDADIGKIRSDSTIKKYDKIKQSTLWVTDDEYRIPLELQTKIHVGFISARLTDLKWLD